MSSIVWKSFGRTRRESSPIWPAISTPVGPPPTTTNVSHARRFSGSSSSAAISNAPRIRPRISRASSIVFIPGRPARELVVTEVGLPGPGGDDQAVVGNREVLPVGRIAVTVRASRSKPVDLGELDLDVALTAKDVADRRGDLALREDARGHLVEQRLEQVVVDPVDQGHLDWGAPQEACGEEPTEAASDDDDPVRTRRTVGGWWVGGALSMLTGSMLCDRRA